jgi:hypothetical protein
MADVVRAFVVPDGCGGDRSIGAHEGRRSPAGGLGSESPVRICREADVKDVVHDHARVQPSSGQNEAMDAG